MDHAAERLREVALQRMEQPEPPQGLAASYREGFSSAEVGRHYRDRLEYLWEERHALESGLEAWRFR